MVGIGKTKCVSYGIVYGVSYYVDSEKAMISEDDRQERELCVKLRRLIDESRLGHF
jgi:hypothetical protein